MFTHASRRAFLASTGSLVVSTAFLSCAPPRSRIVREVRDVVGGVAHRDGAGVSLTKMLGHRALPMLDPFLMLDEFHSSDPRDFIAGFPNHPHRGFETVTLMLDGHVLHEDSVGNKGDISGGGVQWMTAGKGIVHSEMPRASETTGELWGYQLWVNLPAREKMVRPRYQDLSASAFQTVTVDDARVRVLAGRVGNTMGTIEGVATKPTLLDVTLEKGARLRHVLPGAHTAFLHVVDGVVKVGEQKHEIARGHIVVLEQGDALVIEGAEPSRLLVFAGAPIGEPVARRGPFVMNTDEEIQQAFDDYRSGRLTEG
jgi:redox-sensitive bicupin YhaK (pirin superfamily)